MMDLGNSRLIIRLCINRELTEGLSVVGLITQTCVHTRFNGRSMRACMGSTTFQGHILSFYF